MGMGQADGSLQPIQEQYPSLNTSRLIMKEVNKTDFILHIGDISYARGYAAVVGVFTFCDSFISINLQWDEFFNEISPISMHIPYMVCIGNHERDFPNSGLDEIL